MNEEQIRELLMLIDANSYSDFKVTSIEATTKVWFMTLRDYPYDQVMFALTEYFKTGGHFAPKPSDLIEIIHSAEDFGDLNEIEATTLVMKAIQNSAYNSGEEFAKLPPLVQKAVGSPQQLRDWALDEKFNRGVVESNIQRVYRNVEKQAQGYRRMSPEMKALADGYFNSKPQLEVKQPEVRQICTAQFDTEKPSDEVVESYVGKLRGKLWES